MTCIEQTSGLAQKARSLVRAPPQQVAGSDVETPAANSLVCLKSDDAQSAPKGACDLTGRVVGGRFEVGRPLASDSFGVLFAGHDCKLDRAVSLRVLSSVDVAGRLGSQLSAVANLTHPRLVTAFGVLRAGSSIQSTTSGTAGLPESVIVVQSALAGSSVASQMGARRSANKSVESLREACRVVSEVASALVAVQASGPHGAVGPETVWTDAYGGVWLTDLVLARTLFCEDDERRTLVARRPLALAPEVSQGARPEVASDIYGLSALLYVMLTGVAPTSDSIAPLGLPSHVARALAPVFRIGMSPNPGARYATLQAFLNAMLDACREAELAGSASSTPRQECAEERDPQPRSTERDVAVTESSLNTSEEDSFPNRPPSTNDEGSITVSESSVALPSSTSAATAVVTAPTNANAEPDVAPLGADLEPNASTRDADLATHNPGVATAHDSSPDVDPIAGYGPLPPVVADSAVEAVAEAPKVGALPSVNLSLPVFGTIRLHLGHVKIRRAETRDAAVKAPSDSDSDSAPSVDDLSETLAFTEADAAAEWQALHSTAHSRFTPWLRGASRISVAAATLVRERLRIGLGNQDRLAAFVKAFSVGTGRVSRRGKLAIVRGALYVLFFASLAVLVHVQSVSERVQVLLDAEAELLTIRREFDRKESEGAVAAQARTQGQVPFVFKTKTRRNRKWTTDSETMWIVPLTAVKLETLAELDEHARSNGAVTVYGLEPEALASSLSWRLARSDKKGAPSLKQVELFWADASEKDLALEQQVVNLRAANAEARDALKFALLRQAKANVDRRAASKGRAMGDKSRPGSQFAAGSPRTKLNERARASADAAARYDEAAQRANRVYKKNPTSDVASVAVARVTLSYGPDDLVFDVPVSVQARSVPVRPLANVNLAATRAIDAWSTLKHRTPGAAYASVAADIPWFARPVLLPGIAVRGIRLLQAIPCVVLILIVFLSFKSLVPGDVVTGLRGAATSRLASIANWFGWLRLLPRSSPLWSLAQGRLKAWKTRLM